MSCFFRNIHLLQIPVIRIDNMTLEIIQIADNVVKTVKIIPLTDVNKEEDTVTVRSEPCILM